MMKKIFLVTLMLSVTSPCVGQIWNKNCDSLILDKHVQDVLGIKEKTLIEYLLRHKKINPVHISDRKKLKPMNTLLCNDREIVILDSIQDEIVSIYFKKADKAFNPNQHLSRQNELDRYVYSMLNDKTGQPPFGFMATDSIVKYIDNIEIKINGIKEIVIPKELYQDLLFPNFCNTDLAMKPVQSFSNYSKDNIFIYIFGDYRTEEGIEREFGLMHSYMAKLIIDLKTGNLTRIVLRGDELRNYNWDNCPGFTGF